MTELKPFIMSLDRYEKEWISKPNEDPFQGATEMYKKYSDDENKASVRKTNFMIADEDICIFDERRIFEFMHKHMELAIEKERSRIQETSQIKVLQEACI